MTDILASRIESARSFVYAHVAAVGAPPTSAEIADHMGIAPSEGRAVLAELGAQRKVILDNTTGEIWMCGPFPAVPTRFRVHGEAASWWANCAWDMLGIPASLGVRARVETSCACCDEPVDILVHQEQGQLSEEGIVHILLPAREWYNDIGFT